MIFEKMCQPLGRRLICADGMDRPPPVAAEMISKGER
jgi:hypothetical protein